MIFDQSGQWSLDLGPQALAGSAAIIFFAATVRGFTGFGFAIAAVPLLALVIAPSHAVAIAVGLQFLGGLFDLRDARTKCDWFSLRWMMVGVVLGTPAGIWALTQMSTAVAQLVIASICALAVVALACGFRLRSSLGRSIPVAVGFVSGLFNGLAAMPGPPAIAYYVAGPFPRIQVRASLMVFFLVSSAAAAFSLLFAGLIQPVVLQLVILGVPLMACGTRLGSWAFNRTSGQHHRIIAIVLLAAIAAISAAKALRDLI
jgi:uncharacterized membrane protein YfcA